MFSIYNSVPLGDDFAAAIRLNGKSLFSQSLRYGFGMWKTWGGRWLNYIMQVLINPLNSHEHLGRKYGLFLIVLFIICTVTLIYSIYVITTRISKKNNGVITFLIIAIIYTSYYYSECYNWYVGYMAYTVPVVCTFLAVAMMIRYMESDKLLHYIILIVAGVIASVNEFCDIALGVPYLYFVYLLHFDERKNEKISLKIKNAAPLLIFVVFGASAVFAPGNFIRRDYYGVDSSIALSMKQLIIDIVMRLQDLIVDHPLTVLLFLILIVLGLSQGEGCDNKISLFKPVIIMGIITIGSVFPYLYGRAFENTYLDLRMQYVLDCCLEVGLSLFCIRIGQYIAYRNKIMLNKSSVLLVSFILALFTYVGIVQNYAYLNIVQVDILRNSSLIQESYNLWDGIIAEIEQSDEDDVVIYRDTELNWSPYFLYMGLTHGDRYSVEYDKVYDEDLIMPNVYYEKNSITLYYKDQMEQK